MLDTIEKRFDMILKHETRRAWQIAGLSLGHSHIGVWEVLIPLIFIFKTVQTRQRKELFVQNFLFTKKMALDAAREIKYDDTTIPRALHQIHLRTDEILCKADTGLYSELIQTRQMQEIELLMDHYRRLLEIKGDTYKELVRNAYPTKTAYDFFLDKLSEAEKAVGHAAKQTLRPKADAAFLNRLEDITNQTRRTEADEIFTPL